MTPETIKLASLALLLLTTVVVAILGARMLRRDSRAASEARASVDGLATIRERIDSMWTTLQEERAADLATLGTRIDAAHDEARDAKAVAVVARKRVTKKRGPQAAKEEANRVDEFIAGVDANGNVPMPVDVVVEDD